MQVNSINNNQNFGAYPFWPTNVMLGKINKNQPNVADKFAKQWQDVFPDKTVSFLERTPKLLECKLKNGNADLPVMNDIYIDGKKKLTIRNVSADSGNDITRLKRILVALNFLEKKVKHK